MAKANQNTKQTRKEVPPLTGARELKSTKRKKYDSNSEESGEDDKTNRNRTKTVEKVMVIERPRVEHHRVAPTEQAKNTIKETHSYTKKESEGKSNEEYKADNPSEEYVITVSLKPNCVGKNKKTNLIKIYKVVYNLGITPKRVKMVGYAHAEVTYKKKNDANKVLKEGKKENLTYITSYIPYRKKMRRGVIHEWEGSIEELKQALVPNQDMGMNSEKTIKIYTDGSKKHKVIANGIGIITNKDTTWETRTIAISNKATIFITEAIAIYEAVKEAKKHLNNDNKINVAILSDAKSVIGDIKRTKSYKSKKGNKDTNPWTKKITELINKIKQKLKTDYTGRTKEQNTSRIAIIRIPAHEGIEGNEKADAAAKKGTTLTPDKSYKIPTTDILADTKDQIWEKMKIKITNQAQWKGIKYFSRKNNLGNRKPWFKKLKGVSREAITILSRIRSNHYNLAQSLWRKNLTPSPQCECGLEKEDINHLTWNCPKYLIQRIKLMEKMNKKGINIGKDIEELMAEGEAWMLRCIAAFLKTTKRNI
ncbi:unnamed protein product [Xylocopa violacea]|uniref:RNase H type-1 domain-containing protein n=1 Tax=Xylocopa violacea TaxID=135666 RepID=A0ABP1P428_XYLVO